MQAKKHFKTAAKKASLKHTADVTYERGYSH